MTNEEKNKLMSAFTSSIVEGIQAQLFALPSEVKGNLVDALDQLAAQLEATMHADAAGAPVAVPVPTIVPLVADVPEGNDLADAIAEVAVSFLPSVPDDELRAEAQRRGLMPTPYTRS